MMTPEKPLLNLEVHLDAQTSVPLLIYRGRDSIERQLSDFSNIHRLDEIMQSKLSQIVAQKIAHLQVKQSSFSANDAASYNGTRSFSAQGHNDHLLNSTGNGFKNGAHGLATDEKRPVSFQ